MNGLVNNLKTTMLMGSLMGLCLAIGYLIGGPTAMIFAFVFGGMLNLIAFFFSDKIALATMHAQEVGPDDDPALWGMVEQLSQRAGLPMPRVYISPAAAPNAFATGRGPRHSAVCVTAGLRQMLNDHELAAFSGHELSHVKNRDVLISTIAAIMAGAITCWPYMAVLRRRRRRSARQSAGRDSDDDPGADGSPDHSDGDQPLAGVRGGPLRGRAGRRPGEAWRDRFRNSMRPASASRCRCRTHRAACSSSSR